MEQIVYKVGLCVLLLSSMFTISSAAVEKVCTVAGNECESNEVCTDLKCACKPGYTGVSTSPCVDADECAKTADNSCDTKAACTNTVGSFTCACNSGYTGDGVTCTDDDECAKTADDNCDANAACTNTAGSFTCACNTGYTGDGVTCTAFDCNNGGTCQNGGTCGVAPATACTCVKGWTGDDCGRAFDCNNGGTCQNGGTCGVAPATACTCVTGWTGDDCGRGTLNADCSGDATFCSESDANSECDADTKKCVCKSGFIDGGTGACSKAADNSAGRIVMAALTVILTIITTTNLF